MFVYGKRFFFHLFINFLLFVCSFRWPGCVLTRRPYWPFTITWSRKTIGSACRTRTTERGIYTSRRWGSPTKDGTCARSTQIRWKVSWAFWTLSVSVDCGLFSRFDIIVNSHDRYRAPAYRSQNSCDFRNKKKNLCTFDDVTTKGKLLRTYKMNVLFSLALFYIKFEPSFLRHFIFYLHL